MKVIYTLCFVLIGTVLTAQEKPNSSLKEPGLKSNTTQQEEVLSFCEEMPSFKGGDSLYLKYLRDNIEYPRMALESDVEGKVFAGFVVEKDGTISDVKILRGVSEELDREAKRVIRNMPAWNPGKHNNKLVRCRMVVPIVFKLK